jgi:hypothetical protein
MTVPAQYTGDKSTSKHSVNKASATAAQQAYLNAKEKLLSVNEWKKICGPHSAAFQLTDHHGTPLQGKAAIGFYIRVDLPAPKNKSGHDWVMIETIEEKDSPSGNTNYIAMRVRPAGSPTDKSAKTAHFYESTATSTFVVELIGTRLTAAVFGRNEVPNVKHNTLIDKLRNLLISISTILGFQKPQWKSLVVGLLK